MKRFIEVHDSFDNSRHSIRVSTINEVLEEKSESGTHIILDYSVTRQGFDEKDRAIYDTSPAHIFVVESYDEVMRMINDVYVRERIKREEERN